MLLRFIALSAFIMIGAFFVAPAYFGISAERTKLDSVETASVEAQPEITFEQIYALADETENDATSLNNIAPAAGDTATKDVFSNGFSQKRNPAL